MKNEVFSFDNLEGFQLEPFFYSMRRVTNSFTRLKN
ncbi:MAG: hypothetical protein RL632_2377 [Bacteroidota bacterium]|jgi:hypothetical protein